MVEKVPVRIEDTTTAKPLTREAIDTSQAEIDSLLGRLDNQLQQALGFFDAGSEDQQLIRQTLEPFITGGQAAFKESLALAGVGEGALGTDELRERFLSRPDIQFQLEEGRQAVERSGSARGLLGSGAILKELTRFGQGTALQAIGQKQDELSRLAGLGANAAAQLAGIQNQAAQQKSGLLQSFGSTGAQLGTQASLARQSALAESLQKSTTTVSGVSQDGVFRFGR